MHLHAGVALFDVGRISLCASHKGTIKGVTEPYSPPSKHHLTHLTGTMLLKMCYYMYTHEQEELGKAGGNLALDGTHKAQKYGEEQP